MLHHNFESSLQYLSTSTRGPLFAIKGMKEETIFKKIALGTRLQNLSYFHDHIASECFLQEHSDFDLIDVI